MTSHNKGLVLIFTALAAMILWYGFISREIFYTFPLDDAWIHRVYARSFAAGNLFSYNGNALEAGDTSPLWVIFTAWGHLIPASGHFLSTLSVKITGLALLFWQALLVWKISQKLFPSRGAGLLAAIISLFIPCAFYSAFSGMETLLCTSLWLAATYALISGKNFEAAAFLGLLPLARPEALITLAIAGGWLVIRKKQNIKCWAIMILLLALPQLLHSLFCYLANGHIFPNTYYAKAHGTSLTWGKMQNALRIFVQEGLGATVLFFTGTAVLIVRLLIKDIKQALDVFIFLFLTPLILILAVHASRTMHADAFYWTRWQDPGNIVLSIFGILGMVELMRLSLHFFWDGITRKMRVTGFVLAMVLAVVLVRDGSLMVGRQAEKRARILSDSRSIHKLNVRAGVWLAKNASSDERVAINDAGAIRYFSGLWSLDLLGLNYKNIVFKKETQEEALLKNNITWVAVFDSWFDDKKNLFQNYKKVMTFEIPYSEYTICKCPGQTKIAIYKREE